MTSNKEPETMHHGTLTAIWLKRMKLGPMDPVASAELFAGSGLINNANHGGKRQVTMIEQESWETMMKELNADIPPCNRRANLMFSGIRLYESRGKILYIGSCRIRILGETKPCERMDQALQGLRAVMYPDWLGGAYGEVLDSGIIEVGNTVSWDES